MDAPAKAPAPAIADAEAADVPAKPQAATFYCCGPCRASSCCCGRFVCTPRRKAACVAAALLLSAAAVVAIVCGVYFGVFGKRGVKLAVSALAGSPLSLAPAAPAGRRLLQSGGLLPSSAIQSAGASAYAQIDALSLNVAYVRFAPVAGGGSSLASTAWGASRPFTLRSGVNTVPLTATVQRMEPGAYFAADFVYWNRWSLQAFCRTANAFLYTTASGVASLTATPAAMPSDYAPMLVDNMPGASFVDATDTAGSTEAQNRMSFINSVYEYDVTRDTTVNLLLDANQVISCYDGTSSAGGSALIYPLGMDVTYGGNNGAAPSFTRVFDWAAPSFGLSSWTLPVFVAVSSSGGAVASVGETYAFAPNAAWLPMPGSPPVDWARIVVGTLTWSDATPSATLLDMRVRGTGGGGGGLGITFGGYFNFTAAPAAAPGGGLTWSFSNGQQKHMDYNYLGERAFSSFARTADLATVGSMVMADGPECGVVPGPGQQANPCTHSTTTFYFVQLPRST